MRIFISTDAVGGVWNYSLALAAGLSKRGITCRLAVIGPGTDQQQRNEVAAISGCELDDTGMALDWTAYDHAELDRTAHGLLSRAREFGATSLHLHAPSLVRRSPIPTAVVAHSCVATWWYAMRAGPLPTDFAWRAEATAVGLAAAGVTIAPTEAFARVLSVTYPGSTAAKVIHNGLPPSEDEPVSRDKIVLTAGRLWDEAKNVCVLEESAALSCFPIYAAGPCEGPNGSRFSPISLRLLGIMPPCELRTTMARAAIFAAPSRYEPFGLAVLEAAQLGTPLVLSDIPTFRELWSGAALFVAANDPSAWAKVLSRLAVDTAARADLGHAAKQRAAVYTSDLMVDKVVEIHAALTLTESRAL